MKSIIILSFCVVLVVGLEPKPASTVLENYGSNIPIFLKMDNFIPSILVKYKSFLRYGVIEEFRNFAWVVELAVQADASLREYATNYKEDMPMHPSQSQNMGVLKYSGNVRKDQSTEECISAIIQNWLNEKSMSPVVFSSAYATGVGCAAAFMPSATLILGLVCNYEVYR